MRKLHLSISIAILVMLALVGLVAIISQTLCGLHVTAMREPVVWGLYVVGFAYFLGLGAGALTIASGAVFSRREEFRETARIAAPVALVALALAGAMITLDLGRPDRAWMLALRAQVQSPLVIDFLVLNGLLAGAAILTYFTIRTTVNDYDACQSRLIRLLFLLGCGSEWERRIYGLVRKLAAFLVVATPALYILTIRVFATLQARPGWHSTLLGPSFLVSAMLAGTAAVVLTLSFSGANFANSSAASFLRRILLCLATIALVMLASPFLTMRQFTSIPILTHIEHPGLAMGIEGGIGLVLPLVLLGIARLDFRRTALACLLLLVGVFFKRWHIIISAMRSRNIPLPDGVYAPNLIEISAVVGLTACALLGLIALLAISASRNHLVERRNG